jgi:hypothetical protein
MTLSSLLLAAPLALQAGFDPGQSETVDVTLIIFNDEVFTASELAVYMDRLAASRPELPEEQIFTGSVVQAMRDLIAQEGFRRLGLEAGLLEPEIASRIDGMVRETGSRDQFLLTLEKDGYRSIDEFRQDMRRNLVSNTFQSVVTGMSPMPQGGLRVDLTPSPEEIRAEYKAKSFYREQEEALDWAVLQFMERTGVTSPLDRANELQTRILAGEVSPREALRLADRAQPRTGIAEGMRQDWAEFLEFGSPGQVSEPTATSSGVVQFMVIVERQDAREIPFQEAQARIEFDLRRVKRDEALRKAEAEVWGSSYIWLAPNLAELQVMLDDHYGVNMAGSGNSAEL